MNNYDIFDKYMKEGEYIEAALHALSCSAGCASKSRSWWWADAAREAALKAGVELDLGRASRPDLESARTKLKELEKPFVIVTRHSGLVQWLERKGITGSVIGHASPDDVKDKIVIGVLPYHLAALALKVGVVDMPNLQPDQRGKDLTPEEMDQAGANLQWYKVTKA